MENVTLEIIHKDLEFVKRELMEIKKAYGRYRQHTGGRRL